MKENYRVAIDALCLLCDPQARVTIVTSREDEPNNANEDVFGGNFFCAMVKFQGSFLASGVHDGCTGMCIVQSKRRELFCNSQIRQARNTIERFAFVGAWQGLLFKMPPLLALASGFLLAPACALSMSTDLQSLQQSEEARPSMTAGERL